MGKPILNWAIFFGSTHIKGRGRGKLLLLFLLPLMLASKSIHPVAEVCCSLVGIRTYFFRILTQTKDQLRYPASETESRPDP